MRIHRWHFGRDGAFIGLLEIGQFTTQSSENWGVFEETSKNSQRKVTCFYRVYLASVWLSKRLKGLVLQTSIYAMVRIHHHTLETVGSTPTPGSLQQLYIGLDL